MHHDYFYLILEFFSLVFSLPPNFAIKKNFLYKICLVTLSAIFVGMSKISPHAGVTVRSTLLNFNTYMTLFC